MSCSCQARTRRPRTLVPHHDRGHVLEPALGLHEAFELWRERARVEVVHHEQHDGIAACELVHLAQKEVARLVVERAHRFGDQILGFLIEIPAPVAAGGWPLLLSLVAAETTSTG